MKPNRFPRSSRGFTLAEVIVASAIFVIIIVAALLVYDRSNKVFKTSVESADMQQNSRVGFDKLVADVRMAGFDFDRDGIPVLAGQAQQPDEQIEFAGAGAITVRGNFDAELEDPGDRESGRETGDAGLGIPTLESTAFPIVTTENSEIVTYALVSQDASKNTSEIKFYADLATPRNSKPGGSQEDEIKIDTVDTTNANPPYTLYRITIDDNKRIVRTPLAENVRSLRFGYFSDQRAQTPVAVAAVLGEGRYNPASPGALLPDRDTRATIRAVRIEYTGMNGQRDINYVNPTETDTTVTTAVNYRTYNLESDIVPRNLGLRGLVEQEVTPPEAAEITSVCIGACGLAYVQWNRPVGGPPVTAYAVVVDTNPAGSFANVTPFGNVTAGWVTAPTPLDPDQEYYFRVKSLNGYGSNTSPVFPATGNPGIQAINTTKMEPPQAVKTTGDATSNPQKNEVIVSWTTPKNNVSGSYVNCGLPPSAATIPGFGEAYGYEIYRDTVSVVPVPANLLWDGLLTDAGAPVLDLGSGAVTYTDTTAKENCKTYFYKLRVRERCYDPALALPVPNDEAASFSDFSAEAEGNSIAANPPAAPTNLIALPASTCDSVANSCTVYLEWNQPTKDTSVPAGNIQVSSYILHRETYLSGSLVAGSEANIPVSSTPGVPTATYTDSSLAMFDGAMTPYRYFYTVSAVQCTTNQGAFSAPPLIFPCATLVIQPQATGILGGDGSPGNPYLMTAGNATFYINSTQDIASINVQITALPAGTPSPIVSPELQSINSRTYSVDVPLGGNDGVNYRLDATITDINGCTISTSAVIEDSPSNCCLLPFTFNATVVSQAGPNGVLVTANNNCGEALTITETFLDFDRTGGRDLARIEYIVRGTTIKTDLFSPAQDTDPRVPRTAPAPPTGIGSLSLPGNVTIPSMSFTYTIRYTFDRATQPNDINRVEITYRPQAGGNVVCQIK